MGGIRFVGRYRELSLLAEQVEALRAGVGGIVVVAGEQGIGKTALLRAGLGGAGQLGCQVLWASADEPGGLFPLRLMVECISPQGSAAAVKGDTVGLAFGADPVLAKAERLLAAVDRMCAVSPVVLVAEDLQWADDASMQVWDRLSRAAGQMPLLLVGSWRPGTGRADLDGVGRAVKARGGDSLRVGPLRERDVATMVADLVGGQPGRRLMGLVARAGGNPLYARELADGLMREGRVRVGAGVADVAGGATRIPKSLAAAIEDRLAALTPGEADVLRWAAVLGIEFSESDLAVVTGLPRGQLRDTVNAAVTSGVVAPALAAERLSFRHGLIRQVLYEGMPESLRSERHARAALALRDAGAPPEQVAAQLVPGRDEQDLATVGPLFGSLADWLADNAEELTRRVPQAAAALLRAVLGRLADGDSRRDPLEAAAATVSFLLGRHDDTERFGSRLMIRSADADQAAEMAWLVAYTYMNTKRLTEADQVVARALADWPLSGRHRARLIALRAVISFVAGRREEARAGGDAALAVARQSGDVIGAGYALHALSVVAFSRHNLAGMVELADQALVTIGDDPQASDLHALLLTNKASALRDLDQPGAMAAAQEALVLAERIGTHRVGAARFAVAEQHDINGDWDDALAELEVAAGLAGQYYLPAMVHGLIALIAGHRDDRDSMAAHLDAVAEIAMSPGSSAHAWYLWRARALAAEQADDLPTAAAVLVRCLDPAVAEHMTTRHMLLPTLARLAVTAGDQDLAARTAQAAHAEADADPIAVKLATASHCQGLATGDPEAVACAAGYFGSARRPLDEALAREDEAALRAGQGDVAAACAALGAALTVYHRLGATWDARRAEARLGALGVRGPRPGYQTRPVTGWEALTQTEQRVAHLIARGLSNPDVATELFISRNTVHTHVAHILAKLQAHSRAEILRESLRAAWQPVTVPSGGIDGAATARPSE